VDSWSTTDVVTWIGSADDGVYSDYVSAFEEEMICGKTLTKLTAADLKNDLGVTALGPRKRLLAAIQALS